MESRGPLQTIKKYFIDKWHSQEVASKEVFSEEELKERLPLLGEILTREFSLIAEYSVGRQERRHATKKYRKKREWVDLLAPLEALCRLHPTQASFVLKDNAYEEGKHSMWQVLRVRRGGENQFYSDEVIWSVKENENAPRYSLQYTRINDPGMDKMRLLQISMTPSPFAISQVGVKLNENEYYLLFYLGANLMSSRQVTVENNGKVTWD